MQYKVGDVVRIRKDLSTGWESKAKWAGENMTIKRVRNSFYDMKESGWSWRDDDIEGLAEPEKEKGMKYKVGDVVILRTGFWESAARFNGAHAKIMHVYTGLSYIADVTCLNGDKQEIFIDDSDIAGPAESEKQKAMARLYCLISGINSKEITSHIENDTLSRWCNDWRVAAKEALRALGED